MATDDFVTFDIPTAGGHISRGDLYSPPEGSVGGIVVMCHGFMGHRKWGFFPELANRFRNAGLAAFPFDFSHNGLLPELTEETEDAPFYTDPDLFRQNTISREFEDLTAVVRHISRNRLEGAVPENAPIGLFGHSRGGFVVILHALEKKGAKAICTWALISKPDFYSDRQKQLWRMEGVLTFGDSKDGSLLSQDVGYLKDLEANVKRYCLVERIHKLKLPHLLVHGTMDLVVPVESSETIHREESVIEYKRLVTVKTGHTFGSTDSAFQPSDAFDIASKETVLWFQQHLATGA